MAAHSRQRFILVIPTGIVANYPKFTSSSTRYAILAHNFTPSTLLTLVTGAAWLGTGKLKGTLWCLLNSHVTWGRSARRGGTLRLSSVCITFRSHSSTTASSRRPNIWECGIYSVTISFTCRKRTRTCSPYR